ncbi:MAG: hypothetical protein M1819_004737 [Sarea resinae]|nr:MAG: hypothetical protein M1819_004737 [Sarea resinae]
MGTASGADEGRAMFMNTVPTPLKHRRFSVFKEIGLDDLGDLSQFPYAENVESPATHEYRPLDASNRECPGAASIEADEGIGGPTVKVLSTAAITSDEAPSIHSRSLRLAFILPLLALLLPLLHSATTFGAKYGGLGARASPTGKPMPLTERRMENDGLLARDNTPTDICTRWSHQTAIVNGTIYIYGGRATTDADQTSGTWNNDFLSLPLKSTWQISSPTVQGLPQPSGPPPVANGYLFNSYNSLYLYGGEFSDDPITSPVPFAMWEYDLGSQQWIEHNSPQTSSGNNSAGDGNAVQRAAEGAGLTVPELGRGWYFGGHLDGYTTAAWSQSIARVYLKSLLEFTFPGYTNDGVQTLAGGKLAGTDGNWRNITEGGNQDEAGFTERADGILVYVPGWGRDGIILGLAGGTNDTFTQMNVIDVYDIANSTWYKQATSGTTPEIRVNPCAVVAAAADGSSFNVYMYGGQNLIPYGSQTQYDDVWILTIPSFTWIKVDVSNQSVPPARAGHTCNIWDSQMIVVGGYVGQNLSCDSPGIYVFDVSQLKWVNQFTALTGGDTQNQQAAQSKNMTGLAGSYGYKVPAVVQSVIGGSENGGATVTAPVQSATSGPLATGKPVTYTTTQSNGATATSTSSSSSSQGQDPSSTSRNPTSSTTGQKSKSGSGTNVGAIVAGVIAGLLAILAGYLGFCAWVYRRQLSLYKNHVEMSQRGAAGGAPIGEKGAFVIPHRDSTGNSSSDRHAVSSSDEASSGSGGRGHGHGHGNNGPYTSIPMQTSSYPMAAGGGGGERGRDSSTPNSSTGDLLQGREPSFLGVMLNPRRSLRVINRD